MDVNGLICAGALLIQQAIRPPMALHKCLACLTATGACIVKHTIMAK
jgi:hypothetical protein